MNKKTELKSFLSQYLGQSKGRDYPVTQDAIDELVTFAVCDNIEQDIIDYGTENPEAPFWDFLDFIKPGIKGDLTEEDLLNDDDED